MLDQKIFGEKLRNHRKKLGMTQEEVAEKVEIALERESNMKIMAIDEYSGTVMENMKKTHDEIMFLYSMLNDKHTELTSLTGDLQRLAANIRNMQEKVSSQTEPYKASKSVETTTSETYLEKAIAAKESQEENPILEKEDQEEFFGKTINHNDMILALHKEGLSKVDIAKKLNLGVGEVSLVIGLYKGEEE